MPEDPTASNIWSLCVHTLTRVKKLLTQHCSLSNGHIRVTKAYPDCPYTLPLLVTLLWGFYEKEHLQIPGCLALLTTFPAHHYRGIFADPPLSLHILRYAECNTEPGVTCDSCALKAAKKEHSIMEGKRTPGCGVLTTQLQLADIPRYKHQPGECSISRENIWSQN